MAAKRTKTVGIRLTPETFTAAEKVSSVTCRTLSSFIEYCVQRYIEKNFPNAYKANSKIVISFDDAPDE